MKLFRVCGLLVLSASALAQTLPPPLQLGQRLPEFRLVSASNGALQKLNSYAGFRFLAFVFLSTHCQMSAARNQVFNSLASEFESKGVLLLGVYSGRKETLSGIRQYSLDRKLIFPCLRDASNRFADQLGARVTPEVYVFDESRRLRYRGSVDPLDDPKGGRDRNLRQALEALLKNVPVPQPETKTFGCVIDRQANDRLNLAH